jgi:ATPase subunit of ABC transporter with duplicated ATPase domains
MASSKRILIHIPDANDTVIRYGERWHVEGPNGSGKTHLLHRMRDSAHIPVAYLDQHITLLNSETSIRDVLPHPDHRLLLARMGFDSHQLDRKVASLSGGERMRLAMAHLFHQPHPPLVLLLDEPTNHLDMDMREILIHTLTEFDGAIVFASHDTDFVNAMQPDFVLSVNREEEFSQGGKE